MNKTITTEEACTHEPLVDTGVGYYHCPACNQGWSYQEWELKNSKPNLMNKTIEERANELYPESDNPILDELRERQRAAYIAGASENISGSTSTNTQVTTICAKELRGEAGCKELCDECKRDDGWTRVEELIKSDPISFFMTNIMRYMNEEQIKILIEKLILRAPPTVTK